MKKQGKLIVMVQYQLVIKTDFIYRNFLDRAEELLSVWEESKYTIKQVIEAISKELSGI
ncbi:MAG: hypothetical protein H7Y18_02575 [Clostridiaceae bacterium]|nr:hypothetical protein [Clostridiaceae bacterium]